MMHLPHVFLFLVLCVPFSSNLLVVSYDRCRHLKDCWHLVVGFVRCILISHVPIFERLVIVNFLDCQLPFGVLPRSGWGFAF